MFETLSKGFRAAKQRLTGVAELTDDVIDEALRDVRMSLLEADVEFKVVKRFLDRVKESARGEEVQNQTPAIATAATTLASIRPNALRIATLSTYSGTHTQQGISANKVLTAGEQALVCRSKWGV